MGRPKDNLTADARSFVSRVERMLAKGGTDGGLERLACRFITGADEKTAFGVWRELLHYKYGLPTQPIETNVTFSYTEALNKMKEKLRAHRESQALLIANPAGQRNGMTVRVLEGAQT